MSAEAAPAPRKIREDVAQAALAVFLAKGYDRATVRQIADRAGLQASSLYAHIGSKEALFIELILPVLEVGTNWVESVAESDAPPEEQLRLACVRAGELYDLHPEVAIYLSNYSGEIGEGAPDLVRRAKIAWRKIVRGCLGERGATPTRRPSRPTGSPGCSAGCTAGTGGGRVVRARHRRPLCRDGARRHTARRGGRRL